METDVIKVKRCPVCNSKGYNSEIIDGNPNHTLTYVCKACDGDKWVEVK